MINSLHIENYAIIDSIHIEFDEALNIITGETGAGKSIVLGAFSLLMGKRVDSKVIYKDQSKCIIEAEYSYDNPSINKILEANDLDVDEKLIIRREILPNGKSRAFVNDTPSNLKVLQELSFQLVDLNQQFDLMEIQNTDFHLKMLDAISGNKSRLVDYQEKFKIYKQKLLRLKEIEENNIAALKEKDFIQFQFEELSNAALQAGEKSTTEAELNRLNNTEELQLIAQESEFLIDGNEINLVDQLNGIASKWEKYSSTDKEINKLSEAINAVIEDLKSIVDSVSLIKSNLDADPSRLEELNQRIDLIYALEKKHRVNSLSDLLAIQEQLGNKLSTFNNDQKEFDQLKIEIKEFEIDLIKKADALSKARKKHAEALETLINERLAILSMPNAKVRVDKTNRQELNLYGNDQVEILFAPNKGSDFLPIKKIASGGETSRLMLCMKSAVADVMQMPSLIFDEIDTGVSGEVALKMGSLLSALSKNHQVIVITHSPQVASKGHKHFHIFKEDTAERTITHIKVLEQKERITEIAKMLSGEPPSKAAMSNAKELIKL